MRVPEASSSMLLTRRLFGTSAATLAVTALLGCGGVQAPSRREPSANAATVNGLPVTTAAVKHWMSVLAPQHAVPEPPDYRACIERKRTVESATSTELREGCSEEYAELRETALDLIVATEWMVSEAAHRHVPVSAMQVQQRVAARRRAYAGVGGEAQFQEALKATAHTLADLELELRWELAAKRLRRAVLAREPAVSGAELLDYYRVHIARFRVPEQRTIDIVENLKSEREARQVIDRIHRGTDIAALGVPDESFYSTEIAETRGEKQKILKAIFAATPHTIAPVVELNHLYFVFEVTQATPAHLTPFARVRKEIAKRLERKRDQKALAQFFTGWRQAWIARTSCTPGYVAPVCKQYHGLNVFEPPSALQ